MNDITTEHIEEVEQGQTPTDILINKVAELPTPDYDKPVTVGQYWVTNTMLPFLVLELNEYGVIYQTAFTVDDDSSEPKFDFDFGQELLSTPSFKKLLIEKECKLVPIEQRFLDLAVEVYKKKRAENKILRQKKLPTSKQEQDDLEDNEVFNQTKKIIPPPRKYRRKRGLHWLIGGNTYDMSVCKLWDPEKENWILLNGELDPTAMIGFVKSYKGPAQMEFESGAETFEDFKVRLTDFMRQKSFMFDTKSVCQALDKLNPEQFNGTVVTEKTLNSLLPLFKKPDLNSVLNIGVGEPVFKELQFTYSIEQITPDLHRLDIYFSDYGRVVLGIVFNELRNAEFLAKQKIEVISYL